MTRREKIWHVAVPAALLLALVFIEPGEPEQFRPGAPLEYQCSKLEQTPIFVMTAFGMVTSIVEQLEPSHYESTSEGDVIRVAPCVET